MSMLEPIAAMTTATGMFSGANFFSASVVAGGVIPVGGGWTKVDGLGMKIETAEKEEGGNPFFKRLLFNRISYPELTLTRPVQIDSPALRMAIAAIASKFLPVSVEVILFSPLGVPITTWNLLNATITNYKGPSFGVTNGGLAEESITIHHQGFLEGLMSAAMGKGMGAVGV